MWAQRSLAAGAVIRPHQTLNLVIGLARTAPKGTGGGPIVSYTAGQATYTLNEQTGVLLAGGSC